MELKHIILTVIFLYLALLNVAGFAAMGADKQRARRGKWRIKEKTLFLLALLGGSPGCWLGMYVFRHKTKHWYFVVGMPLILVLEAAAVIFILYRAGWMS